MNKLKETLEEVYNDEVSLIEQRMRNTEPHVFSAEHEAAMKSVGSKANRKYVRVGKHHVRKAVLVACILALIFAFAMGISAIRKPIIGFIVHYEDLLSDIEYVTDEESDLEFEFECEKPQIPEGFKLVREKQLDGYYSVEYENETGDYIWYTQFVVDGSSLSVDTENANAKEIEVNGYKALETSKYGTNTLTWTNGVYGFTLVGTCDIKIFEEIAIKIS